MTEAVTLSQPLPALERVQLQLLLFLPVGSDTSILKECEGVRERARSSK
jgi:hypothetical protein